MKSKLEQLKQAVAKFEATAEKNRRFGATDTEPDGVFQQLLVRAFKGKEVIVPGDVRGWELYSGINGNGLAAYSLARAALKCVHLAQSAELRDSREAESFLRDYCWRIYW